MDKLYSKDHLCVFRGDRVLDVKHKDILEDKLISAFGKTWVERGDEKEEVDKFVQIVMECCEDEKLASEIIWYWPQIVNNCLQVFERTCFVS